jgi:hypothetical protein
MCNARRCRGEGEGDGHEIRPWELWELSSLARRHFEPSTLHVLREYKIWVLRCSEPLSSAPRTLPPHAVRRPPSARRRPSNACSMLDLAPAVLIAPPCRSRSSSNVRRPRMLQLWWLCVVFRCCCWRRAVIVAKFIIIPSISSLRSFLPLPPTILLHHPFNFSGTRADDAFAPLFYVRPRQYIIACSRTSCDRAQSATRRRTARRRARRPATTVTMPPLAPDPRPC